MPRSRVLTAGCASAAGAVAASSPAALGADGAAPPVALGGTVARGAAPPAAVQQPLADALPPELLELVLLVDADQGAAELGSVTTPPLLHRPEPSRGGGVTCSQLSPASDGEPRHSPLHLPSPRGEGRATCVDMLLRACRPQARIDQGPPPPACYRARGRESLATTYAHQARADNKARAATTKPHHVCMPPQTCVSSRLPPAPRHSLLHPAAQA